jgi:D-erythrulose 1-phosphate 3-epimerase
MKINLGINTGFALNRFTPPEDWIPLVGDTFGLKIVQFTADLLNPALPEPLVKKQIDKIQNLCAKHGVEIRHTFTSAFTRVNHLAHPDPDFRQYWQDWFFKFIDISRALGAESLGSHLGILTVHENNDPEKRNKRIHRIIEGWREVAKYASEKGLKYLLWEPMSISRELGETLVAAQKLHKSLNSEIAIPMKMCLDVDHGDLSSQNPDDTDPYAWLNTFCHESPLIHLKQPLKDKGGHWPFTPEKNKDGKIVPKKLIDCLEQNGVKEVTLLLELSFREREPFESRVIDDILASIDYWRPHVTL